MIITKYPDWVEDQLKILDDRIADIYREFGEMKVRPDEVLRIKQNLYEAIKPYVDEKVRLISNSVPTYIFKGDEYGLKIVNKGNCMMCGKELAEDDDIFFCKECEQKNQLNREKAWKKNGGQMNKRQAKKRRKRRIKDQIEYLTDMLYKQLGINKNIIDRYYICSKHKKNN